jgi:hypothetical protein
MCHGYWSRWEERRMEEEARRRHEEERIEFVSDPEPREPVEEELREPEREKVLVTD